MTDIQRGDLWDWCVSEVDRQVEDPFSLYQEWLLKRDEDDSDDNRRRFAGELFDERQTFGGSSYE